jgi:hypothetical protein
VEGKANPGLGKALLLGTEIKYVGTKYMLRLRLQKKLDVENNMLSQEG